MEGGKMPFLTAALPGPSFGLPVGIRMENPRLGKKESIDETSDPFQEEDKTFSDDSTSPNGVLGVHLIGCKELDVNVHKIGEEINILARVIVNGIKKDTEAMPLFDKQVVWDEVKFFSIMLSCKALSPLNTVTVMVIAIIRTNGQLLEATKHLCIGKVSVHTGRIVKNRNLVDGFNIINQKQKVVGRLELEMSFSYGHFGYGQSYQRENNLHGPTEMVKTCLFPRVEPPADTSQFRGFLTSAEKVDQLSFLTFTPKHSILKSKASGSPVISTSSTNEEFPLLCQQLKNLDHHRTQLQAQGTRRKKIAYLRNMLQGHCDQISEEYDDSDFMEEKAQPISTSVAIKVTSPLLSGAPGINRRAVQRNANAAGATSPVTSKN